MKNIDPHEDTVENVRKANERMQDGTNLDDYASMTLSILSSVMDEKKREELEKLGWHYLETGQLRAAFSIFYEIIKTPEAPPSAWLGLITFYEKYKDPASAILNCQTLIRVLTRLGRDEEVSEVTNRIAVNYQHLTQKAITNENEGELRFAFNCYRAMIEYGPAENIEAYAGYMRNAIPSGKPEEAYDRLKREPDFRKIVLGDPYCATMYLNLIKYIEENPIVESTQDQFENV